MDGYKIGELSRLTGIPTGTIRFYERMGLIPMPPRTISGYRNYPAAALERLQLVRRIKDLGFSLGEIAELLDIHDQRSQPCREQRCRAAAKLKELNERINELVRIKNNLQGMVKGCEATERKCTLLSSLAPLPLQPLLRLDPVGE